MDMHVLTQGVLKLISIVKSFLVTVTTMISHFLTEAHFYTWDGKMETILKALEGFQLSSGKNFKYLYVAD